MALGVVVLLGCGGGGCASRSDALPPGQRYAGYTVATEHLRPCEGPPCCGLEPRFEVVISPTEIHAVVIFTDLSMTIPRDGREWAAFGRWLAVLRAEPLLEGHDLIRLVPRAGVRYAEIVRALELADHHGFGTFEVLSGRASEIDRPGPLRLRLSRDHLEGEFVAPRTARVRVDLDARGWAQLEAWLAARRADPQLDGADPVDVVADRGADRGDRRRAEALVVAAGFRAWASDRH